MEEDADQIYRESCWASVGYKMAAKEANSIEKKLLTDSDNLELRCKLLGYYFSKQSTTEPVNARRFEHVCWMIRNHPAHHIAGDPYMHFFGSHHSFKQFAEARELWIEQTCLHPDSSYVHGNFAQFVIDRDLDYGLELLQHALKLDETQEQWASLIILFCSFKAEPGPLMAHRRKYAELALTYAQAATNRESEYLANKISSFEDLATCALFLNKFELAEEYANSSAELSKAWRPNDQNTFQQAVLGTIALRKNDTQTASNYLLDIKSGDQVEQPMFQLAQEMLACEQHLVVAEFLRRLLKLKSVDYKLDCWRHWLKQIEKGESPQIGNFRLKLKTKK
ncbi:MAG: hypothetical protein P4L53_26985 [Candidatus Obscuribacterales bacterium]|nr:hypothetical protein [Candidatus Obscuribacterales bacterium]